jgi:hypothetical protein
LIDGDGGYASGVAAVQPSVRDMSGIVFGAVQSDHELLPLKLRQTGIEFGDVDRDSLTRNEHENCAQLHRFTSSHVHKQWLDGRLLAN